MTCQTEIESEILFEKSDFSTCDEDQGKHSELEGNLTIAPSYLYCVKYNLVCHRRFSDFEQD